MSLIAHYLLNNNAGNTTVVDASGNGYTATAPANTSGLHVAGKVGSGALAPGTGTITRAHTTAFGITGDLTIAFWFKNIAGGTGVSVCYYWVWGSAYCPWNIVLNYDYALGQTSLGRVAFMHADATTTAVYQTTGTPLNDTNWHHICITRSSPWQIQNTAIYVGGASQGVTLASGLATRTAADTAGNTFAMNNLGQAGMAYDDFRLYNEVISAETLTRIYNGGAGQEANWPPYLYHRRPTLIGV